MKNDTFKYEIKKQVATLSDNNGYTTEVNLISFNGGKEKLDIRKWNRNEDRMLKGISLTDEEVKQLKKALVQV